MICIKTILNLFALFFCLNTFAQLPKGFVYANSTVPNLYVELRYCGAHNFVGSSINGYKEEVVIVTAKTAEALQKVQAVLRKKGLALKVYDAYRPQRAVNEFVLWAKRIDDTLKKQEFYPNVKKRNLFKEGYIASRSRHSSGSTLDVTLVNLKTGAALDMGTPYDFFGKESWVNYTKLTKQQKANRALLQNVMLTNGFHNYPQEWWHFTLKQEPFRGQYFDFPVE